MRCQPNGAVDRYGTLGLEIILALFFFLIIIQTFKANAKIVKSGKVVPVHAVKACEGCEGMAPLSLNFDGDKWSTLCSCHVTSGNDHGIR